MVKSVYGESSEAGHNEGKGDEMMKFKLAILFAAVFCAASTVLAAVPVVTNVVAQQRPDTKLVDIYYDVEDDDGDLLKIRIEVSDNAGTTYSVPAFSLSGDIGDNIEPGTNKHIVWDAGVDWDGEYSDQMRIKVIASDTQGLPGLVWGSEVPPGGFLMGQDGGPEGSGPSRHVNIPWSYWLSKYEIRNDEYCEFLNMALLAGEVYRDGVATVKAHPDIYDGVPGGSVLINLGDERDIRWSVNKFEVSEGRTNFPVRVTWFGAIAFAQHYGYDLPTEAEWEKAARGPEHEDQDTHLVYPWGNTLLAGNANYYGSGDPWSSAGGTQDGFQNTTPVGYYDGNQTPFGPDMANEYGLYDMIGNVSEWTRTTWSDSIETYPQPENLDSSRHALTNSHPTASNDLNFRAARGGSWQSGRSTSTVSESGGGLIRLQNHSRLKKHRDRDFGYSSSTTWADDRLPDMGFRVIRRDLL